ncbi:luciferase family protein [Pedobacter sp. BMA]|uniref:luciferase domain-containing protein n=1 Tax=Pedobacter sp. BMA TaxID=1663685 RepID=UPI00064B40E0|nr:luciferase family protein [Pedobacter sp. BMA]KLT65413.1 hypothetical protein AB669_10025 [Pedobacter sp. BMA]
MLFSFVVKYLGFLKGIPLLAQIFDNVMKLWLFVVDPERLDLLDELENTALKWEQNSVALHQYGGIQFNFSGKEFAHVHSNGILDILLSAQIKSDLILANKVSEHHLITKSGWVTYYLKDKEGLALAIDLLALAYKRVASRKVLATKLA